MIVIAPSQLRSVTAGVTDDAWENAARHYDEEQLAALVSVRDRCGQSRVVRSSVVHDGIGAPGGGYAP
jgi:hypothetical protein